jgi:hypothetical protein
MLNQIKYRWVPLLLALMPLVFGLVALGSAVDWKGK